MTSTILWIYRDSACLDYIVCHQQNSVSTIQGLPFSCLACPVWGPTGSVFGPILFVLYAAEIDGIIAEHRLEFHQSADDCHIYIATSVSAVYSSIDQLSRCLHMSMSG